MSSYIAALNIGCHQKILAARAAWNRKVRGGLRSNNGIANERLSLGGFSGLRVQIPA
jgi:hypothetical protein